MIIGKTKFVSILQDHKLRHSLHNEINYPNPRVRTLQFQNSFIPKTVNDWNNLDNDIKMSTSLESIIYKHTEYNKVPPKSWYYTGDHQQQSILHSRLRMLAGHYMIIYTL